MAGLDKNTRILLMYSKLLRGGKIQKKSFCLETGIDRRTFDRDIEDIRLFLSETFSGNDLVYDRAGGCYYLENLSSIQPLSAMEVALILDVLRSSGVLRKDEFHGIGNSLLQASELHRRELLQEMAAGYQEHYKEQGQEALLKLHWDLQECIQERDMIQVAFRDRSRQLLSPVSLWAGKQELYLFAFSKEKMLQVYPLNEISSFRMAGRRYPPALQEAFYNMDKKELLTQLQKARNIDEKD